MTHPLSLVPYVYSTGPLPAFQAVPKARRVRVSAFTSLGLAHRGGGLEGVSHASTPSARSSLFRTHRTLCSPSEGPSQRCIKKIVPPESVRHQPGVLVEAISKGLAYLSVHPLKLMRVRSIEADCLPSLKYAYPFTALGPCAVQEAAEYALAMFISQQVSALTDRYVSTDCAEEGEHTINKHHPLFLLCKNIVAATASSVPSLCWSRVNQQLILGHDLRTAVERVLGHSVSQLCQNPGLAKEFLRGLPIAVLNLAVYLTVQDLSSSTPARSTGPNEHTVQESKPFSHFGVVANMALVGLIDGIVDCVTNTGQLHGLSAYQALYKTFSHPLMPLAYGVLGALSMALAEFALNAISQAFVKGGVEKKAEGLEEKFIV